MVIFNKYILLLFSTLLLFNSSSAQLLKRRYAKKEIAPTFILVQLNTNAKLLKQYEKAGNMKGAKQMQKDVEEVNKNMVWDFTDNFSFCPYYFYYDTNANLIEQKLFNGILLDKELKPLPNNTLSSTDTNYRIVLWGYNIATADDYNSNGDTKDPFDGAYSLGTTQKRLVVMYPNFKRVQDPEPNGLSVSFSGKSKNVKRDYKYTSPKFNIYYKPRAKQLSDAMSRFFAAN